MGYALKTCAAKGVREIVIAGQFAKLLKVACGHEQTHVSSSELDLQQLVSWLGPEPRASGWYCLPSGLTPPAKCWRNPITIPCSLLSSLTGSGTLLKGWFRV